MRDNVIAEAVAAIQTGNDAHVVALLTPWVSSHSGDMQAHHILGVALHRQGDLETARKMYSLVLALDPENADVLFLCGQLEYQANRGREAAELLGRLLDKQYWRVDVRLVLVDALVAYVSSLIGSAGDGDARQWAWVGMQHAEIILNFDAGHPGALGGLMQLAYFAQQYAYSAVIAEQLQGIPEWRILSMSIMARSLMHLRLFDAAMRKIDSMAACLAGDQQNQLLRERALVRMWQGKTDEAIALYEQYGINDAKVDDPSSEFNYSLCLLASGRYAEGWKKYATRRQAEVVFDVFNAHPWRGEDLQGKTLLIHSEQGAGDVIQFLRFIPALEKQGARVVFNTWPDIVALLGDTRGAVKAHVDLEALRWDYHARLMDLPGYLGVTLENMPNAVPYLSPTEVLVDKWAERLAVFGGLRVGLAWAGNATHGNDHNRSASLFDFADLAIIPGVTWFGLHKGQSEREGLTPPRGMNFVDLHAELDTFADTAAIIANLDLVISVDTSIAHLAGALGKPVWVLLPWYTQEWRWPRFADATPWYPTMRLFHRGEQATWQQFVGDDLLPALLGWGVKQRSADVAITELSEWLGGADVKDKNLKLARTFEYLAMHFGNEDVLHRGLGALSELDITHQSDAVMAWAEFYGQHGRTGQALELWAELSQGSGPVAHDALLRVIDDLHVQKRYVDCELQAKKGLSIWSVSHELLYRLGRALQFQEHLETAELHYKDALAISPRHLFSRNNLGYLYKVARRFRESLLEFQRVVGVNPFFALGWRNIGQVALELRSDGLCLAALQYVEDKMQDDVAFLELIGNAYFNVTDYAVAERCFDRQFLLQKNSADALLNRGLARMRLGRTAQAVEDLEQAVALRPDFAKAHFGLVWHYLAHNQTEQGWRHFSLGTRKKAGIVPEWHGEPLSGRHLLVYQDYGYGDFWQFVVLLRQLQGERVTLAVNFQAVEMMQVQSWGINVIQMDHLDLTQQQGYDLQINLMDLARIFKTDLLHPAHHGAYLVAPEEKQSTWAARLAEDKDFRVGVVWAGNPKYGNDRNRSTRLSDWFPLTQLPGVSFYSLQKDKASNQAVLLPQFPLVNLVAECETLADTAALIMNLDLVIAVDTGLAHLAAAMGQEVWVLLASEGTDWRWQNEGESSPWYPHMRLFRQQRGESWGDVLKRVALALSQRLPLEVMAE